MKNLHLACIVLLLFATACGLNDYDNYDAPNSILEGNIVYDGEPIPVEHDEVSFQLWQSGFGEQSPIEVSVAQDGSYSAELFNGEYRLILNDDQGPYITPTNPDTGSDTLLVQVNGNETFDIEVMPYHMIRNASFSVSDNTVSANLGVEKILSDANGGKSVEEVFLFINKTQFVDDNNNINSQSIESANISDMSDINISLDVPSMTPNQGYVFARVGVVIEDIEPLLFTPVQKLQLD